MTATKAQSADYYLVDFGDEHGQQQPARKFTTRAAAERNASRISRSAPWAAVTGFVLTDYVGRDRRVFDRRFINGRAA